MPRNVGKQGGPHRNTNIAAAADDAQANFPRCICQRDCPIGTVSFFIAHLEQAQMEGDIGLVSLQIPWIERLIAQYQDPIFELRKLQYRARLIRERHKPAADKRR